LAVPHIISALFVKKTGSGTHSDPKFSQRGEVLYLGQDKSFGLHPERRSVIKIPLQIIKIAFSLGRKITDI
jgi:hypothetical protein